jgi:hypothetical protein
MSQRLLTRRSALGFGVLSLLGLPGSLRASFFPDPPAVAALADPPPVVQDPPPVQTQVRTTTRMVTTYRRPRTHSHTCRNGHTWDHALNPTHTCQICGAQQFVQDTPWRMIPVTSQQVVEVPIAPAWTDSPPTPANTPARATAVRTPTIQEVQRVMRYSQGCASGNCPVAR